MRLTEPRTIVRRQRLLARIHRRYVTVTQTVRIGAVNLEFTRIADPDKVLDQVAAEADRRERISGKRESEEHLHLPYWAELWDSAAGIGQFLQRDDRLESIREMNVLDLGCGMGLSGTVAAALGANVTFADLEPPALLFARLNSLPWAGQVRARRLNWKTDRLTDRFDLIIGADILYERQQWEFLEPFWRHHLNKSGTLLLGEPGRQTGDLFVPWIREREWEFAQFEEKVPTRDRPVRIFRLRRKCLRESTATR